MVDSAWRVWLVSSRRRSDESWPICNEVSPCASYGYRFGFQVNQQRDSAHSYCNALKLYVYIYIYMYIHTPNFGPPNFSTEAVNPFQLTGSERITCDNLRTKVGDPWIRVSFDERILREGVYLFGEINSKFLSLSLSLFLLQGIVFASVNDREGS